MNSKPRDSSGRHHLRFPESVFDAFAFLSGYGFERKESLPTFGRFESPDVFVNVYHGRSSYELGVELGTLADKEPFSLLEVVESSGGTMPRAANVARSASEIVIGLKQLAEILSTYGVQHLRNDEEALQRLDDVRERKFGQFLYESRFDDARALARQAWHASDYSEVVRLLRRIPESERLPIERKRLMKAEAQLGGSAKNRNP
jgi:hypothetical protein